MLGRTLRKRARACRLRFVSVSNPYVGLPTSHLQLIHSLRCHALFTSTCALFHTICPPYSKFLTKVYSFFLALSCLPLQRFDDCSVLPKVRSTGAIHLPSSCHFVPSLFSPVTLSQMHSFTVCQPTSLPTPKDVLTDLWCIHQSTKDLSSTQSSAFAIAIQAWMIVRGSKQVKVDLVQYMRITCPQILAPSTPGSHRSV
jgi:hypothetical protein